MTRQRLLSLALVLTPALLPCLGHRLACTTIAQETRRPAGVTPSVDSEDEPVDPRLSIEFNRRYQDLRSGSPLSIDWTLTWDGPRLPRGHLDVHVIQGRRVLGRLLSRREIVLTDSGTRFRTLLPPFNTELDTSSPLDIRAFFISDAGVFPLGERSLRIAGPLRRSFVVAFCEPWQQTSSQEELLFTNSMNIEPLVHAAYGRPAMFAGQRLVTTYPARIYPTDVPTDPLWLCEFNVLVLLPDGLRNLRRNQLEAIVRWVDAGGNLCVFIDGNMAALQVDFVNRLTRTTAERPRFPIGDNGLPQFRDSPARLHKGLGRVVIHQDPPLEADFLVSSDWQASVAFLWNQLREPPVHTAQPVPEALTQEGGTEPGSAQPQAAPSGPGSGTAQRTFSPPGDAVLQSEVKWRLQSVNSLVARLTPDDFEVVPLWLLGLLLIAYIVVIGPVDYLVLGWLGVRKLTWIVFPLMTVAFTVLIVWISHEHMGTSGNVRQLIVRDIGDGGGLARENRFDLHLVGSHTTLATSVARGLFTPIDHRRFLSNGTARSTDQLGSGNDSTEPSEYIGTIPVGYTALQDLPQWSPQVNRVFRIAPEEPMPAFDWESVEPESLATAGSARSLFQVAVQEVFGPRSTAMLFHTNQAARFLGDTSNVPLFPESPQDWFTAPQRRGNRRWATSNAVNGNARQPSDFLRDACVRPSRGVFRAVSQVAPHGGDNFEDLALLDPTDPGQWLLVIAVADGDSLLLYRHLYHDRPAPESPTRSQSTVSTTSPR